MVKPVYHRDREDAPFSRGLKAHLPLWMELVARTGLHHRYVRRAA